MPHPRPQPEKRNLQKVPFVELFDGRLQGVVSSGSSAARVYVSLIEASSGNYYCSTNNNRPCGGLGGGGGCKHIGEMVKNAIAQYGEERVSRYLGVPESQSTAWGLIGQLGGGKNKVEAGEVFARFLDYLRYVELEASTQPRPEMAWFVTG